MSAHVTFEEKEKEGFVIIDVVSEGESARSGDSSVDSVKEENKSLSMLKRRPSFRGIDALKHQQQQQELLEIEEDITVDGDVEVVLKRENAFYPDKLNELDEVEEDHELFKKYAEENEWAENWLAQERTAGRAVYVPSDSDLDEDIEDDVPTKANTLCFLTGQHVKHRVLQLLGSYDSFFEVAAHDLKSGQLKFARYYNGESVIWINDCIAGFAATDVVQMVNTFLHAQFQNPSDSMARVFLSHFNARNEMDNERIRRMLSPCHVPNPLTIFITVSAELTANDFIYEGKFSGEDAIFALTKMVPLSPKGRLVSFNSYEETMNWTH